MAIHKKYTPNTGERYENRGHTVKMQMDYDVNSKTFEGKWYVETFRYTGSGCCTMEWRRSDWTNI